MVEYTMAAFLMANNLWGWKYKVSENTLNYEELTKIKEELTRRQRFEANSGVQAPLKRRVNCTVFRS